MPASYIAHASLIGLVSVRLSVCVSGNTTFGPELWPAAGSGIGTSDLRHLIARNAGSQRISRGPPHRRHGRRISGRVFIGRG